MFQATLDLYFTACRTAPDDRVSVAATFLKDDAVTWWVSVMNEREWTWPAFVAALMERFSPLEQTKTARVKIASIRQFGNESVQGYCEPLPGAHQRASR